MKTYLMIFLLVMMPIAHANGQSDTGEWTEDDWRNPDMVSQLNVEDLSNPANIKRLIDGGSWEHISDSVERELFSDDQTDIVGLGLHEQYNDYLTERYDLEDLVISKTGSNVDIIPSENGFSVESSKYGTITIDNLGNFNDASIQVLSDGRVVINKYPIKVSGSGTLDYSNGKPTLGGVELDLPVLPEGRKAHEIVLDGNKITVPPYGKVKLPSSGTYEVECFKCTVDVSARAGNKFPDGIPISYRTVGNRKIRNSAEFGDVRFRMNGPASFDVQVGNKRIPLGMEGDRVGTWSLDYAASRLDYNNVVANDFSSLLKGMHGIAPIMATYGGMKVSSKNPAGTSSVYFQSSCQYALGDGCINTDANSANVPWSTKVFSDGSNPEFTITRDGTAQPATTTKQAVDEFKQKYRPELRYIFQNTDRRSRDVAASKIAERIEAGDIEGAMTIAKAFGVDQTSLQTLDLLKGYTEFLNENPQLSPDDVSAKGILGSTTETFIENPKTVAAVTTVGAVAGSKVMLAASAAAPVATVTKAATALAAAKAAGGAAAITAANNLATAQSALQLAMGSTSATGGGAALAVEVGTTATTAASATATSAEVAAAKAAAAKATTAVAAETGAAGTAVTAATAAGMTLAAAGLTMGTAYYLSSGTRGQIERRPETPVLPTFQIKRPSGEQLELSFVRTDQSSDNPNVIVEMEGGNLYQNEGIYAEDNQGNRYVLSVNGRTGSYYMRQCEMVDGKCEVPNWLFTHLGFTGEKIELVN